MNKKFFVPELIVYDFDGVMTDNRVFVDENGTESVAVHRGDGYAVRMIKDKLNITQIILSTEANPIVVRRAAKLGIPAIHNSGDEKCRILLSYCHKNNYKLEKTMYIGNDLNDLEAMQMCGMRLCPLDAEQEIKEISDHIFTSKGGFGVIREFYRLLTEEENG